MDHGKQIISFIGLAIVAGIIGSALGAGLFGTYIYANFYWDLYQQFGNHWRDMGLMPPDVIEILKYSAIISLAFTIIAAVIIGVPLAYGFRKNIFRYPKVWIFLSTIFGSGLAIGLMKILFRNVDMIAGALPFFGGAVAFTYSGLIAAFRGRLNHHHGHI